MRKKFYISRLALVQAMYQVDMMPDLEITQILQNMIYLHGKSRLDLDRVKYLLTKFQKCRAQIIQEVKQFALKGSTIDLLIIAAGMIELAERDLPAEGVISVYLKVCHQLGSQNFLPVVNKVLDSLFKVTPLDKKLYPQN